MSNEIVQLRAGQDLITFDEKKIEIIRKQLYPKLSEAQFEIFISSAKARGLDPVLNQIHAVTRNVKVSSNPDKYEDRMTIQVGIDGFRLIAARTGEFVGCDETKFEFENKFPVEARVTVYRLVQGQKAAFTGVAYWDEFYPGDKQGFMWKSKPRTMLAKCAEAQALRKAFPNDLSGVYEPAEVEQVELKDVTPEKFSDDIRTKQIIDLIAKFKKLSVSEGQIKNKLNLSDDCNLVEILADEDIKFLNNIGGQIVNRKITALEAFPIKEEVF